MALSAAEADESRLDRIPFGSDLWLVPIRHHSPACALHLQALIRRVRPSRILIEGPADATALIPHLGAKDARPPLAIYCFHTLPARSAGGEPVRHRSFFPMAGFSPEWIAIREGLRVGAEVRFIDLPYAARVGLSGQDTPESDAVPEGVERTLAEDRLLQQSWATSRLVERAGCRDFNEWWDRYFESRTPAGDPETFFRTLLHWCLLLRPEFDTGDVETAARERAMASAVRDARAEEGRCLAITGGYHCEAIARLLEMPADPPPVDPRKPGEQGTYLIPYSLSRLDAANGYAAGIADSGYYQALWRQRGQPDPRAEAIRVSAARVARQMRERGEPVTLPDVLEATLIAHRLGALRACPPGRPELFDAMETAFAKTLQPDPVAWRRLLRELAAEACVGRVPEGYPLAPLVEDFRARCKHFRLAYAAGAERVRVLDLYRSERHREVSRFLWQLGFLGIPYAEREAGPDFVAGTGLDRVRETWRLRWRPETDSALTECSLYGAQIGEAASGRLSERLDQGGDAASLLISALQMGLRERIGRLLERLSAWLGQEGDFVVLVAGLARIELARNARHLLEPQDATDLDALLGSGFRYACRRLSWIGDLEPERDADCAEALGLLNGLARPDAPWCDLELFRDSLIGVADSAPAPILAGRSAGILTARGLWPSTKGRASLERAMRQGELTPIRLGGFLQGFLPPTRALLVQEPELIAAMSRVLLRWDEDQLLAVLPHLRLAFTALKPREAADLGALIARLLSGEPSATRAVWSDRDRAAARQLHDRAFAALKIWGFTDAD
ncbi:DUF5682 family protein [Thiorhodococcus fuscus]|uniref:DUF5682 family protein n=1 Tax=Thiorhodococcus fuscus TaxID=527200 RepID=A0ABW4Y955_9GAMM